MAMIAVPGIELGELLSEHPMRYAVISRADTPDAVVEVIPFASPARREAIFARLERIQRDCQHPSLAAIRRVVRYGDHGYVVVSDRVRGSVEPPCDRMIAVEAGIQLAGALAELHDSGVVHGDVRAETIAFAADRAILTFPAHAVPDDAQPIDDIVAVLDVLELDDLLADLPEDGGELREALIAVAAAEPIAVADAVEGALVASIRREPADLQTRRVYADWLEEHGDASRAAFLRAEVDATATEDQLLALARPRDLAWRTVVSRAPIAPHVEFKFACPKRWDALAPTETDGIRHCGSCERAVYFCASVEQARARGRLGQCIAIDAGLARGEAERAHAPPRYMMMGEIA